MPSETARSSITVIESNRRSANFVDHDLEREVAREEKAFESYGGDDPHEPPSKKDVPSVEEQADANMVTWDGPDDPTNPQNWSKPYKWFITVICCVMTVNVYVTSIYITYISIQRILQNIRILCANISVDLHRKGIWRISRSLVLNHYALSDGICGRPYDLGSRI
jgi:hypothetical protein